MALEYTFGCQNWRNESKKLLYRACKRSLQPLCSWDVGLLILYLSMNILTPKQLQLDMGTTWPMEKKENIHTDWNKHYVWRSQLFLNAKVIQYMQKPLSHLFKFTLVLPQERMVRLKYTKLRQIFSTICSVDNQNPNWLGTNLQ